jgi:membrane-bound lytic murein transglycosylase B
MFTILSPWLPRLTRYVALPGATLGRFGLARLVIMFMMLALIGAAMGARAADPPKSDSQRSGDARPAERRLSYPEREDVREFIRLMVSRHGFAEAWLDEVFSQARHSPRAVTLMTPAPVGTRRSWQAYRDRVVDPVRVESGLAFWREHDVWIRRATERYGVPGEIIVAIIGVETLYGRVTGDFRVLDTLTTLSFDYLRRADFFRTELEQFLLMVRDNRLDPTGPRGSYAGAIGVPQFMPGSIRRHAVDFDGDGRVDLQRSVADAVGSVASFLVNHGWRPGEPSHFPASVAELSRVEPLIAAGIEPQFSVDQMRSAGVTSTAQIPSSLKLALVDLPNIDQPPTFFLGANNFYVVTRYNRSSFYAMGVLLLAAELRAGRGAL